MFILLGTWLSPQRWSHWIGCPTARWWHDGCYENLRSRRCVSWENKLKILKIIEKTSFYNVQISWIASQWRVNRTFLKVIAKLRGLLTRVKLTKQDKTLDILQVIQVDLGIVSRDQTLNLRCGEHVQPLWVNDAAEASNEGWRLFLDLSVHAEVSHQVDVADPAANKTMISYKKNCTKYMFQF